jgi:hypothetical protein
VPRRSSSVHDTFLSCTTLVAAPPRNAFGRLLESSSRALESPKQPTALGTSCLELALMHGIDQAPDQGCCIPQDGPLAPGARGSSTTVAAARSDAKSFRPARRSASIAASPTSLPS